MLLWDRRARSLDHTPVASSGLDRDIAVSCLKTKWKLRVEARFEFALFSFLAILSESLPGTPSRSLNEREASEKDSRARSSGRETDF